MTTVREQLVAILQTDAQSVAAGSLGALMGHRATAPYGIFFSSPPAQPDYPLITYFLNTRFGRFPHRIAINITAWGPNYDAVLMRIEALLHLQQVSFVGTTDFAVKLIEHDWDGPDSYDDKDKIYYRQSRYLLTVIRK